MTYSLFASLGIDARSADLKNSASNLTVCNVSHLVVIAASSLLIMIYANLIKLVLVVIV